MCFLGARCHCKSVKSQQQQHEQLKHEICNKQYKKSSADGAKRRSSRSTRGGIRPKPKRNNVILQRVLQDLEQYKKQSINFGDGVVEAWNALGLIRLHMEKNFDGAIICFEKTLALYKHPSSMSMFTPVDIAVTLADLAKCYECMEEQSKALIYYKEAVCLLEQQRVSEAHPALTAGRRSIRRLERFATKL